MPDDLKPKERMSKNWPLQVRVKANMLCIDVDNSDIVGNITVGQYVFRQFLTQVVQAGRSFVFFCRTSREKLDLLRALSDGYLDMADDYNTCDACDYVDHDAFDGDDGVGDEMIDVYRSCYLDDEKQCLIRSIKTCEECAIHQVVVMPDFMIMMRILSSVS